MKHLSNFFRIDGRISRLGFFPYYAIMIVAVFALSWLIVALFPNLKQFHAYIISGLTFLQVPLLMRRFHDLNQSGIWAIVFCILPLGIINTLCWVFLAGQEERNKYGTNPYRPGMTDETTLKKGQVPLAVGLTLNAVVIVLFAVWFIWVKP